MKHLYNKYDVVVLLQRRNMNVQKKKRNGGFSLFELLIVIIIISILMVFAIQRLLVLQVDAERVVMESVVGSLRSALGIKVAETIVKQNVNSLPAYEGSNPMNLLAEIPGNYLGEIDASVDLSALERGNWYFDSSSHVLIYIVDNTGYFSGGADNPPRARFKVRLVYTDKNENGLFDYGTDSIEGLRLQVLEPYRWIR